jgi:hypothetical protein
MLQTYLLAVHGAEAESRRDGMTKVRIGVAPAAIAFALAAVALALLVFARLGHPLLWHDEASTAVFGQRVLEYGVPKVHGAKGVVYGLDHPVEVGVNEALDAYLGSPWAQYYFAAGAVALAEGATDLNAKTARLRLPFAVVGVAGLAVLLLGILPAVGGGTRRRLLVAAIFLLLCAGSISLVLHLREVRYYALTVFLVAALVNLFLRRHVYESVGPGIYAAALVPISFLLFNTFYPAFGAFVGAAALHHLGRALRRGDGSAPRWKRLLQDALPLAAAALAVAPLVVFYEIPAVTGWFLDAYDEPEHGYLARLVDNLVHLLRYELLAPVLLTRLLLVPLRAGGRSAELPAALRVRLAVADFLTLLVAVYVLLVARTPFYYERYYIALSPLLCAIAVLDGVTLLDLARVASHPSRRIARDAALAFGAALVVLSGIRLPELRGRLQEIATPVRGPLDHLIPYLQERYERPERLVVATNYEGPALMYYLDSIVLVGFYAPDLNRDFLYQPDVIVPRRWPRSKPWLGRIARRARYGQTELPVEDPGANNVPSLSPHNQAGLVHRFRPDESSEPKQPLVVLELEE